MYTTQFKIEDRIGESCWNLEIHSLTKFVIASWIAQCAVLTGDAQFLKL